MNLKLKYWMLQISFAGYFLASMLVFMYLCFQLIDARHATRIAKGEIIITKGVK